MAQMTMADVATHGFLLDGKWGEDGDVYEVKAPYDGAVVGRVVQGRREHAEAAIAAAVKAFGTTRRLRAYGSGARDLHVHDRGRREHADLRRISAAGLAGIDGRAVGDCKTLSAGPDCGHHAVQFSFKSGCPQGCAGDRGGLLDGTQAGAADAVVFFT